MISGDRKSLCVCVCVCLCVFILHSSLARLFQMSTAVAHFHCLHSLPTPSSCLQVYPVATAKLMVAFTQIRRVSTSLTLGGGGGGAGERGMTLLVTPLFVRGIGGVYDQLVGVLRMKREFRAISPLLQPSSTFFNILPLIALSQTQPPPAPRYLCMYVRAHLNVHRWELLAA